MSSSKKLHPVSIVFTFFRQLKDLLIPLIFGTVALFQDLNFETLWIRILAFAGLMLILVAYSTITWYRFTYRVEEDELRIEHGVFVRKKRYISKNRIQSIDLSAGPLHRLFQLVRVDIQTAGSDRDPEAGLKAVSREEGEWLRSVLHVRSDEHQNDEEKAWGYEESEQKKQISFSALLLAATTSGGIGVFLSIFTVVGSQLNQLIPDDFFYGVYQWMIATGAFLLVIIGIAALFILWLMAIAGTILKYNSFTIEKFTEELRISRGLLEKKQLTVPLKRIQAIRIQENLLREPFGYAVVYAEVAGGSADQAEDFSTVLFPLIKKKEIPEFLASYVPDYHFDQEWKMLPKRAARRFILRALFFPLLLAVPGLYFFPVFWWVAVIVLAVAAILGYFRYKAGGIASNGEDMAVRSRLLSLETVLVKRKRIQAFTVTEHIFQRRVQVKTLQISVASTSGTGKSFIVKDVDTADAGELMSWYSFQSRTGEKQKDGQTAD